MRAEKNASDQRVQRTYRELKNAFEALLCQTEYEDMTVLQLCQAAGIRRTTFYQHFQDKQDFLNWFIREKQNEFFSVTQKNVSSGDVGDQFVLLAKSMLNYLQRNEQLVKSMINAQLNGQRLFEIYLETCVKEMTDRLKNVPELVERAGGTPISFLSEFYVGGMIAALRWWVIHDKPCAEEELLKYIRLRVERKK